MAKELRLFDLSHIGSSLLFLPHVLSLHSHALPYNQFPTFLSFSSTNCSDAVNIVRWLLFMAHRCEVQISRIRSVHNEIALIYNGSFRLKCDRATPEAQTWSCCQLIELQGLRCPSASYLTGSKMKPPPLLTCHRPERPLQ